MTSQQRNTAVQTLKNAREALAAEYEKALTQGGEETPEWQAANAAVIEAEKNVPWWRR